MRLFGFPSLFSPQIITVKSLKLRATSLVRALPILGDPRNCVKGQTASGFKHSQSLHLHSLCHSRRLRVRCVSGYILTPSLVVGVFLPTASPSLWIIRCINSSDFYNMYRSAAGKLSLRATQASRSFSTSCGSHGLARGHQNALIAGRKPLAVMARSSLQRRGYAMAAEETNKGVVCCSRSGASQRF